MAKKATKKVGGQSVMEQLAAYQPPYQDAEPVDPVKAQGDQVKSLSEQLAKVQAQLDARERSEAYRSFQGMPSPTQTDPKSNAPLKTTVDLEGMPDPVTDTAKYNAEMAKRINEAVAAQRAEQERQMQMVNEQAQLAGNLWNGFKTAHPDWADHEMLVGAAAGRVSQSLKDRGVDVAKVIKQQPDLFYGEVVAVLDKQYPQLKKAGDEDDEGDEPAEVFGGQPGGKGGSLGGVVASMEDDNKAWLKELGDARGKAGVR